MRGSAFGKAHCLGREEALRGSSIEGSFRSYHLGEKRPTSVALLWDKQRKFVDATLRNGSSLSVLASVLYPSEDRRSHGTYLFQIMLSAIGGIPSYQSRTAGLAFSGSWWKHTASY